MSFALSFSACSELPDVQGDRQFGGEDGSITPQQFDGSTGDQGIMPTQDAQVIHEWNTRTVFEALEPMCGVCHGEGQSSPYFASLSNFVDTIVADENYIVLGEPDSSELLTLLDGSFDGPLSQMPPSGDTYFSRIEGDLTKPDLEDLRGWIERLTSLPTIDDQRTCATIHAPKLLHRLNRLEYNRSVQTLLETTQLPANDFPSEDQSFGFDNIAQALAVSPLLVEKYDLAAQALAEEALPTPSARRQTYFFEAESEMTASTGGPSGEGWNLWSNGSLTANVNLPAPGRYQIVAFARQQQAGPDPAQARFTIDGQGVYTFNVSDTERQEYRFENINIEAGFHIIGIEFLNDYYCPQMRFDNGQCGNGNPALIGDRNLIVDWVSLEGPLDGQPVQSRFADTFLQNCDLTTGPNAHTCARDAVDRFARFAWRRPITQNESDRLWTLASAEFDQENGLTNGLRQALHAILLSPHFLFRVEQAGAPGSPLNGYERATRLSMFLWRTTPSEALLDQAADGILDTPEGVAEVASAMFDDAIPMMDDLANQWLLLHQARLVDPDYALFPDFDEALRDSMVTETTLLFRTLFVENRPLLDLVNADFTFIDERLAAHYDLPAPTSRSFERIDLPAGNRKGVLTHASWLSATSQRTRTSPVKRGKWVLEELLCAAPPPPPPSVEGLPEDVDQNASLRERLEQHRADPECATCHTHMDAAGFGLEQFDAIGEFRTHDGDDLIEPTGALNDGTPFSSAIEMADAIRRHPDLGPCLTNKILIYALGRGLEDNEFCFVDDISNQAARDNYETRSLINAIVQSPLFLNRGENQSEASQMSDEENDQ